MKNNKLINPNDYDVVICIDERSGRLFEYGRETTPYIKKIELSHEAGYHAELTVKRRVIGKDIIEHLEQNNE